jgi:prepilin-type N-terminal cleavage/methylation domain-containing protein
MKIGTRNGFSLIEILISVALLAVIAGAAASLLKLNIDQSAFIRSTFDVSTSTQEIESLLSDQTICTASFSGINPSSSSLPSRTRTQLLRGATPIYKAGVGNLPGTRSIYIQDYQISTTGIPAGIPDLALLTINVISTAGTGPKKFERKVLLHVETNNNSPMVSCIALAAYRPPPVKPNFLVMGASGNFNVVMAGTYTIIAKGDQLANDNNLNNELQIDNVTVDTVMVGDFVAKGGKGGGAVQSNFMTTMFLSSGTHSYLMRTTSCAICGGNSYSSTISNSRLIGIRVGN